MNTSWDNSQAERYRQLAKLWQRVECLTEGELGELCALVARILHGCSKANLARTDQTIDDLIHSYIAEKILFPLSTGPDKFKCQMPVSHGALIYFFQNFVISIARKSESRLSRQSDAIETDEGDIRPEVAGQTCETGLIERLQGQGFSVATLQVETAGFLNGMSPIERTVLHNYCSAGVSVAEQFPNSPRQQSLARVAMAQMGLWQGKTQGRDLQKFSATRLGHFMTRVIGQPLDETHLETMEALMSLLCELA